MTAALWEWSVTRDTDGGCVGVSATRHGAMEALAKALVRGRASEDRSGGAGAPGGTLALAVLLPPRLADA